MTFEEAVQILKDNGLGPMADAANKEVNGDFIIQEAERVLYYIANPMPSPV